MICLEPAAREQLVAHSRAVLPNEACGLLIGTEEHIMRFVPLTNAAASPTHFTLDPHEQLVAERAIDAAGETVIGIAHSHTAGDNSPSAVDVTDAERFDPLGMWLHVVVSPVAASVRAFRIVAGEVEEIALHT
ncbi:MAG: M67 family metallopeptidase [Acidimicrobiales bacterium]|nr:M67 family metallopeptidase [Acidimicrobiales bacterium]MDG1877063.1 M67 family metallopeptidase [Acidimicrobiales bacterium]